ncbi:potassium transporter TrkH [Meridianimarinicoccus roseus]|jgi:trk system potassium uptake protein TrkH|uniref:Trk system potassium uptake protein n=1 Tax=Meridianimarinicoccus roseus TaxID=2072018 RepID=A0A2V2LEQ1_9RHOB|nr:TrkH family potassium uptake protein [Meridianimarinicoccus roseus]PWR03522.1 potassium transporter TrkH [Meridianimarinicoccus roseus]
MIDFRPVGYVIGFLVAVLGTTMIVPVIIDLRQGNGNWVAFVESAAISIGIGGAMAISCANSTREKLSLQQIFLLTSGVWVVLPVFGALPFWIGETDADFVDAFFEAMSGLTTTGSTVLSGLDGMSEGVLLWRGMLQWFGGVGIIVVAMVFLPELGVGGMQIFKSEGFETDGKILPRARAIAAQISVIYLALTVGCAMLYAALGMAGFDALVHAMTTVSTGGFSNYDASFGRFDAALHYVCTLFMVLAALPFVRYVQIVGGHTGPLLRDRQIRTFLVIIGIVTLALTLYLWKADGMSELSFREALFNSVSVITGTGYASADYGGWGAFPVAVIFFTGLIGGCAGSTACSIKVFRYQLLFASLRAQIRRIHSPNAIFVPRYDGRPVSDAVLSSVMVFFVTFILLLGLFSVALGLTGLDVLTSVSGAATAIANIGPGLGPIIGPTGNFATLNDTAKWLLCAAMLLGRLELLAVLVILTPDFWRD